MNELETVAGRQTDGRGQHRSATALTWMIPAARPRRASAALILAPQSSPAHPRRNADRPDVPFSQVLLDRGAAAGRTSEFPAVAAGGERRFLAQPRLPPTTRELSPRHRLVSA